MSSPLRLMLSLDDGRLRRVRASLPHKIKRPVFVVAPPRSGSTYLFECLARLPAFTAFTYQEADHLWWRVLPYNERRQVSDLVEIDELDGRKRALLKASFYVEATRSRAIQEQRRSTLSERFGLRSIRYLDKTISNCFHLTVLSDMFPDARFLFLIRDPRANIASMIEGWANKKQFGKDALDNLVAAGPTHISHWSYPAPPGWREVLNRPLPEICAWMWQRCVEHMLDFSQRHSDSVSYVRYEHLLDDPESAAVAIDRHIDTGCTTQLAKLLTSAPPSRTTLSPVQRDKWRRRKDEIDRILPTVKQAASHIGYEFG